MKTLTFVLLILFTAVAAREQDAAKIREYMDAAAKVEKFSGTVLVARKGRVVFERSYGLADRAKNLPNTNATRYFIGSMTKSITGTGIMALRDQGKVRLDASICEYLKPCPEQWKPMQVQHLLTHTSGVPDIVRFPEFMELRTKPHTPQQLVELFAAKPVEFAPGAKFFYSNSNFILLATILEKVCAMPYEDCLKKNVFSKAGMENSGNAGSAGKAWAVGYMREGDNYREPDPSDMSNRFGAGDGYSTADDLMRLLQRLAAGKVLKPATVEEMWKDRGHGYGYGWFVENDHNRRAIGHQGRVDGYTSSFRLFRDEDLVIVVLSNINGFNTERVSAALDAIEHGEPYKMPKKRKFVSIAAEKLAAYDGKYKLPWGLVLVVTHEGNQLFGRAEQEKKPTEWKAESDTLFYVPPADINIEFVKDAAGKITMIFDGSAKGERIGD
jgi:CubicO group peptidase (beta-lactamase class C family)